MNFAGELVPLGSFALAFAMVWMASRSKQAKARLRADMQKDLLAKFSSAQELAEFLKTDGGKLLMPEPVKQRNPAQGAGTGILVLIVGLGFIAASMTHFSDPEMGGNLRIGGFIMVAAGIGLIISAYVTHRLSRQWAEKNPQAR